MHCGHGLCRTMISLYNLMHYTLLLTTRYEGNFTQSFACRFSRKIAQSLFSFEKWPTVLLCTFMCLYDMIISFFSLSNCSIPQEWFRPVHKLKSSSCHSIHVGFPMSCILEEIWVRQIKHPFENANPSSSTLQDPPVTGVSIKR